MSVDFKEGAVCFAGKRLWRSVGDSDVLLSDRKPSGLHYKKMIKCLNSNDFQLNTPCECWYIHKSEINTEQKYNDVVEVFGLFGFYKKFNFSTLSLYDNCFIASNKHIGGCSDRHLLSFNGTKCTYNQLMAIGKLKRMIDEKTVPLKKDNCWKPVVGEEVEAVLGEINSMRGELLALTKEYAIIQQGESEQHLHLKGWVLREPKSEEDIIREQIKDIFTYTIDSAGEEYSSEELADHLLNSLYVSDYKIVKGDACE